LAGQQSAVDELQNTIKADQAAIDNAKAQLSYTSLVAPFDGITGIRLLDVGNVIQATTTSRPSALVVVTQVQPISVIFTLATTSIPRVQDALARGQPEAIAFSQDDKMQLDSGKLLLVDNQADPSSGTVRLKAQFPNLQRRLWPGTFVNVQLVLSTQHNGLTVPLDAIQQGPQGQVVFVVGQDHRVTIRPVSTRQSRRGEALIDSGLSAGAGGARRSKQPKRRAKSLYSEFGYAAMNLSAPFIHKPIATVLRMAGFCSPPIQRAVFRSIQRNSPPKGWTWRPCGSCA
jgi:membrane fusion protein, multidrug efflux system